MHTARGGRTAATEITLRDIYRARQAIAPIARRTPLVRSQALSELAGTNVYLKLENLQETGSFKIRGAANRILHLTAEQRGRGVSTVSTGNHGRAVACVAGRLGIPAVICVSSRVPANKIAAIQQLGAEVAIHGDSYDEAEAYSIHLQQERGLVRVEPFDDPYVIAGQGTIGLELLEDLPDIDTVVVPLSGGGLLGGIALTLKTADPAIHIVGVSMERAPVMVHSLRSGRPIEMEELPTLADALAGGIGLENRHTFRLVQDHIDQAVLVSEEEIAAGMAWAIEAQRLVVEGGGAVGIAALLQGRVQGLGKHVAVVASGGNVDLTVMRRVLDQKNKPGI